VPEAAGQSSATLACDFCGERFERPARGPLPRLCSPPCRRAWTNRQQRRRSKADRIAAELPQMTGAQRRHFEQVEQLLRIALAVKGPRRKGDV
jgi:hypothetical protein